MALTDIIRRIETDADADVASVVQAAQEEAEVIVSGSRREAEAMRERVLAEARARAHRDADTRMAAARLKARDASLRARAELVDRVMREARTRLVGLDDEDYARLLARSMVASARGGETVRMGREDLDRLRDLLPEAVRAEASEPSSEEGDAASFAYADDPGALDRGVVLEGDRMRVEISPDATLRQRHDELAALAADILFGDGSGDGEA